MSSRIDRVQATVTVWFDGAVFARTVALDYVPGDDDQLARALLDKARELNLAAAMAEAAAGRPLDTGGLS